MPKYEVEDEQEEERTTKRTRRSCDRCTAKKVKCDGAPSCSNCTLRGYQCHYSEKRRTGPKIKTAADENPELANMVPQGGLVPWVGPDRQGAPPPPPLMGAASPITPASFTPNVFSDAHFNTLLTKVEAEYLETFFRDFNLFLPVTDESMVRAAIMRFQAGGHLPVQTLIPQVRILASEAPATIEDVQEQNAQNAILWAAVAIGGMMQGLCADGVSRFASLAWLSMKECFDYDSKVTVSAYLMMATLYQFLGEMGRTYRYVSLAEEMSKGLEDLSPETNAVLLYLKAGTVYDLAKADAMYRQLSDVEEPADVQLNRVLHLLTKCKTAVIYNKTLNESNCEKGLPRVPLNFSLFMDDLQMADLILAEEPAANTTYARCYIRGFLGVMTFLWHGDLDEAISIMSPALDAVLQHPGIQRMHPCLHFMHTFGIMLAAAGQWARYDMVQHAQTRVKCKGEQNPVLPPSSESATREGFPGSFCPHVLCQLVHRHVTEARISGGYTTGPTPTDAATSATIGGGCTAGPSWSGLATATLDWDSTSSAASEAPDAPPMLVGGNSLGGGGGGIGGAATGGSEVGAGAGGMVEDLDFLGDLSVEQIEQLLEQPGDFFPVGVC